MKIKNRGNAFILDILTIPVNSGFMDLSRRMGTAHHPVIWWAMPTLVRLFLTGTYRMDRMKIKGAGLMVLS